MIDVRLTGQGAKIFRGSTPLIEGASKIEAAYLEGDQRKYMVRCRHCGFLQHLQWSFEDNPKAGFKWETEKDVLILESVCYCCVKCGKPHYEHDKATLFSEEHGAHWKPTCKPKEPGIRSYHLPAFYSPVGLQPWYKCVSLYLSAYDHNQRKVKDIAKYQVVYNNIFAEPFELPGTKLDFEAVSAHRRNIYRLGEVPNKYAACYSGSPILMLTCSVDVHKHNIAVAIFGWCKDSRCYVIDYWRFNAQSDWDICSDASSSVWHKLRDVIEKKVYVADDNKEYKIAFTVIDSRYATDTVTSFCSQYLSGVVPLIGRDRPTNYQRIREFAEFTTKTGQVGYQVTVDHYKDRLAVVLRRPWETSEGIQPIYYFNAPLDIPDRYLKELTVETRRKKEDTVRGITSYYWYRPSKVANELWDLLVYAHAAVDIIAWNICIQQFELDNVDWNTFWNYLEVEKIYYDDSNA